MLLCMLSTMQDLHKNVRRELSKLKLLLQQYAILAGQAQLFAADQAGKGARTTLVSTGNAGQNTILAEAHSMVVVFSVAKSKVLKSTCASSTSPPVSNTIVRVI